MQAIKKFLSGGNLVLAIAIAMGLGFLLAQLSPSLAKDAGFFGQVFVGALRAIAPLLVFILVLSSIANKQLTPGDRSLSEVLMLYFVGTLLAALVAVLLSFLFPSTLELIHEEQRQNAPQGVAEVLKGLVLSVVDNPFNALTSGNFIGVLFWAPGLGIPLRQAQESTKQMLGDLADAVSHIVNLVIGCAPLGIFSLVAATFSDGSALAKLHSYGRLLAVLLGAMLLVMFVINPLLVYWKIRRNPYPLVWQCVRESGLTAFFTRSSAANIPVNLAIAKRLDFLPQLSAVAIPLGATINMAGAAITITVLTLAAANTLGITVDFATALLLSFVASVCACGSSGVAGGSLLLIPLSCSLFKISNAEAAQVMAVGFVISIIQDSAETALNSSTDVVFTGAVSLAQGRGKV